MGNDDLRLRVKIDVTMPDSGEDEDGSKFEANVNVLLTGLAAAIEQFNATYAAAGYKMEIVDTDF